MYSAADIISLSLSLSLKQTDIENAVMHALALGLAEHEAVAS